ncbi:hypothetical protein PUMCH_001025 [Australozyma saopauloensis]|uniref:SAGA complex subunit Spt7 n=1 Tax=Australozyma saopauloensis TaxID=291208 RepID=A0AAX4H5L6_9ASCO|nr:hypothetical protein PUMCH_001025 [[Candida] saopauloensis]
MAPLATFEVNDERKLFALAKEMHKNLYFQTALSNYQFQILNKLLEQDDYSLWANFLEGNCVLQIEKGEKPDADSASEPESIEEGLKPMILLALNVRYLLYEKAIDFYYYEGPDPKKPHKRTTHQNEEDFQLIELLDTLPDGEESEQPKAQPQPAVRREVDDYDDYDDDDGDDENDSKAKAGDSGAAHSAGSATEFERNSQGAIVIKLPEALFETKAEPSEAPQTDQEPGNASPSEVPPLTYTLEEHDLQIINFNKIYHNFEYDRETLLKRRKLEKSDMQLENLKHPDGEDSVIPISLGTASHSLKHLLSTIQERRDDISLNDIELRGLFMDIRKNRGKWANDERVGQEELYEACEKVLLDLRGNTEHSTPFLNKVSKREAPNYGLIIKKPMDLNTVMKKLKALSYNSKAEFVDDLMLIWNNCLTYNADPKHFLRAHAIAMQKLTQKLASSIPNITIRVRSELDKDEENDADAGGSTPAIKGGKKASKKGRMRRREEIIKAEETEGLSDSHESQASSIEGTPLSPSKAPLIAPESGSVPPEENQEDEDEEAEEGEDEVREEDNDGVQDTELQAWKNLTAKSRAKYCAARAALFDDDYKIVMNADAVTRELGKMSDFNQFLDNKDFVSKGNKLLDNDEPYLLEYDVAGGIPGIEYEGVDDSSQERYENHMVETLLQQPDAPELGPSSLILPTDRGLNKLYSGNLKEIQEIRKICFKISLIRQMQTLQFVHRTQMQKPEIDELQENDIDAVSKLQNHDINDESVQFVALRRNISKIAMHTGFESTELGAINTLTQIAEQYMLNLAKTLKLHTENSSRNQLSLENILLLSLLENGVDKPADLCTFVQEKVEKNRVKLKDLRVKLSGFLKDLLRPSLESINEKNFDDNSEQFTTGDFTSELGDDFFGFKELGLDKEFKMLTSSIPVYLLHSKLQNSFNLSGPTNKSSKYEDLKDWKVPRLTKEDVSKQIGLLQPFYLSLASKLEALYLKLQKRLGASMELPPPNKLYLLEDEELPQKQRNIRPRLPPTGKITLVKKKPLSSALLLPEDEVAQDPGSEFLDSMDIVPQD